MRYIQQPNARSSFFIRMSGRRQPVHTKLRCWHVQLKELETRNFFLFKRTVAGFITMKVNTEIKLN